jgi:hypothetical protein
MYKSKLSLTATNILRSDVWTLDSLPPQDYPRRIMAKMQTELRPTKMTHTQVV